MAEQVSIGADGTMTRRPRPAPRPLVHDDARDLRGSPQPAGPRREGRKISEPRSGCFLDDSARLESGREGLITGPPVPPSSCSRANAVVLDEVLQSGEKRRPRDTVSVWDPVNRAPSSESRELLHASRIATSRIWSSRLPEARRPISKSPQPVAVPQFG